MDILLQILYFLNAIIVFLMVYKIIKVYPMLPEKIPSHFDFQLEADKYGSKNIMFIFPILGLVFLTFLYWPIEDYNYPVSITEENQDIQKNIADIAVATIFLICNLLLYVFSLIIIHYDNEDKRKNLKLFFWNLMVLTIFSPIIFIVISYLNK